ncbi:MAG: TonB-dependent receptor [Halioglobus sp.]|nr:TonB-dependent receptor [Halioglobus sp.]
MHSKNLVIKSSLLAIAVASASAAFAQAPRKASPVLEETIVTAQRKTENIQDAAISIDAATKEELTRLGITDVKGLSKIAPALSVVNGGGSNNVFFVRGVGNFSVNAYTDAAVAFNQDGVFIGRPTATSASFLDLERVEVLKGPQGTLYGRNATAGAINVIPAKPELGETYGNVAVGAGNYETVETTGAFNLALGDQWAARLAGGYLNNDGYNDDGSANTDDAAFRVQIYGELSDKVDVRLSADYSTIKGDGNSPTFLGNYGFPFTGPSGNPNNLPGYNFNPSPSNVSSAHTGAQTNNAEAYYASLTTQPAFTGTAPMLSPSIDNTYWGVSGELNVDLGFGDLVVIPAYRESDGDVLFNNPGFQAAFNDDTAKQSSLEARLSFDTGPVDWILGAYYFDEKVDGIASFNQQSVQSTQELDKSTSESAALFASGTYNLTQELRLVGGVRWTDDQKQIKASNDTFIDICIRELPAFPGGPMIPNCDGAPVVPAGKTVEETLVLIPASDLPFGPPGIGTGPVPYGTVPLIPGVPQGPRSNLLLIAPVDVDSTQSNDKVTYRLAVEYDLAEESLLYASYETGYRSGGFNLAYERETYDPETLDAYTIGSKNRFMDDRLQVNAEAFYWEYDDQQASHFGLDGRGNTAFFTENVGNSTIKGVELDVVFALTSTTRLTGNVQYLENEIDDYSYLQQTPDPAVQVVTGCNTTLLEVTPGGEANWDVDCSGQDGRNAPKWSTNLGIEQAFDFDTLSALFTLDMRYRDDRWIGFDYTPPQRADSVTTFDATFELGSQDGTWSVLTYVRNFTDEDVKSITQVFGNVSNLVSTAYEPPRTYGLRLTYNF